MYLLFCNYNCMNILLIFNIFLFLQTFCSFLDIEKISDNGDYFVVLDSGLYIYNFEKKNCKFIRDISESNFDENNEHNTIIISKNEESETKEIKITVLINEHLYVYTHDESNKNVEYILLESLKDNAHNIYPFNVQIDNNKLTIYLIKYERHNINRYYFIKSFYFSNYLQIQKNEPNEKKYNDFYVNKPICQFDKYEIKIKCLYFQNNNDAQSSNYQFLTMNGYYSNRGNKIENEELENSKITITFSQSITFFCSSNNVETKCYYKQTSNNNLQSISHSFEGECLELKAYFFEEKKQFVLTCTIKNYFYLYIFNDNDITKDIKEIKFFIEDYKGKSSIIFNKKINNYVIVYDYNFTITCEEYNQDEELNIFSTSIISDEKETSHVFDSSYILDTSNNEEKSTFLYKTSEILQSSQIDKLTNTIDLKENIYSSNRITHEKEILKESEKISQYKDSFIIKTEKIENIEKEVKEEETKLSKEEIINNIASIINDKEIGKNYQIKGDDFTIIIKPTNSTSFKNSTHVDFDECERLLRYKYNISNSSIITFFQMEIQKDDKNALYNQIKYFTYDDKKKELDLNLCNDIETKIHYNLKEDSNIDIMAIDGFKKKGIDIFNIKDEFFNNICNSFSDSDNDMILEDRIKYIFQNYSLCEDGCTYNNFDLEKTSITCNCKIKGNFNETTVPLIFEQGKEASFLDSNIGVVKCYNLVLKLNNKLNNLGFIILTFLLFFYIIFFFCFIINGIKSVSNFVFNEMVKYGYLNKGKNGNFKMVINKKPKHIEITTSLQKNKKKVKGIPK